MLSLRTDKWLRVGCGVGLLLLLAAQERVCPWLSSPQPPQQEGPKPAANSSKKTENKRPRPVLSLVPSDAPMPSKPAAWAQSTARLAAGERDGVVSSGLQKPKTRIAAAINLAATDWHALQSPLETGDWLQLANHQKPPPNPAVGRCIIPTGPPRA